MYWDDEIELLQKPNLTQDSAGNVIEGKPVLVKRLCNAYTVGAEAWATSVDLGLRADAEVQLWAFEYNGESEAIYHECEFDIEKVTQEGDYVRLQLGRHVSND